MFAKNIQKSRVSASRLTIFIRFEFHIHTYSHFTLCYTSRQCYTIVHHVYIYEFSRRISENPQSETRPHSSPDPSCGREISRGRANPFPQTNCFVLPSPFRFLFRDFRQKKFG